MVIDKGVFEGVGGCNVRVEKEFIIHGESEKEQLNLRVLYEYTPRSGDTHLVHIKIVVKSEANCAKTSR